MGLLTGLQFTQVVNAADEGGSFSGTIGAGAIIIDSGNNLNPNGSKRRLESLDEAAERETTAIAIILPRLTWNVAGQDGLKVYFLTDPPIDEVGGFALNLGASYRVEGVGVIDGAAFFTPFVEAWQDPYLVGVDRQETDTTKYGMKIGLNRIAGSGFRVNFVYLNDDVDTDIIGTMMPDLARDGAVYSLNMNYSLYPAKGLEIRPRVSFRKGEYDGEANSFSKYKFELEARYMTGSLMVTPRVHYSYSGYDKEHPVFKKTRDNNSYGISLAANYMAPFNLQDWSVMALLSLSKGDSNIDFYDTEAITFGCLVNYHF